MPQGGVLVDRRAPDASPRRPVFPVIIDGATIVTFSAEDRRVTTALAVPHINRHIDVTVSPATAVLAVRQAAATSGTPATLAETATTDALSDAAASARAWSPDPGDGLSLIARVGGTSYPLLGAAYDQGAGAIRDVPRWAAPIMAAPTAREAARVAFASKATRPVIAALARTLGRLAPEAVDCSRLALALVGIDVLEPDHLARILLADGPGCPVGRLPEPHGIRVARRVTTRWGAERTMRLLEEASRRPDGLDVFFDCIRFADDLAGHAPARLPMRLTDLHDLLRSNITSDPAPRPRYDIHFAPQTSSRETPAPSTPIRQPRWLEVIDRHTFGGLRFVLPRTGSDLRRWSRLLANCLDTFQTAAVEHRSHLVGVEVDGRLAYAIELTPSRRIRQFAGYANRRPSDEIHDRVVNELRRCRVIT